MGPFQYIIAFLGRVGLSLIFILSGFYKIFNWESAELQLQEKLGYLLVTASGIGWFEKLIDMALIYSSFCIFLAIFLELIGGILLFLGVKVRFAAILLLIFLIPTTIIMHHFWGLHGNEFQLQLVMFLKNMSIIGGLLLVTAYGQIRFSAS